MHIYGKQEPCGPLFTRKWKFVHVRLQSQADWNTAQILVFLDDILMLYQAFGVNLM